MSRLISLNMLRENKVGLRCPDREGKHYRWIRRSIEREGITTPLVVRKAVDSEGVKFYEIIDGHHRFQVLKDLKSECVRCEVIETDDLHVLILQLRLNKGAVSQLDQEDFATGMKRIMMHNPLMTLLELARDIPMHTQQVEKILGLNKIPVGAGILNLIRDGKICLMNAYALARLPGEEQINWVDRAMSVGPRDFIPLCNARTAEIEDKQFMNKSLGIPFETSGIHPHYERRVSSNQNPCGEVTLGSKPACIGPSTLPNKAILPKRPGRTLGEMLNPSITKALDIMDATIRAFDWKIAPKGIFDAQMTGRMSGREPSSYELLHGPKPRISEVKIKYTANFSEAQPLVRKGWDHVKGQSHGKEFAYCAGSWLVTFTGRCWSLHHPKRPRLNNLSFTCAPQAMDWIEENFRSEI